MVKFARLMRKPIAKILVPGAIIAALAVALWAVDLDMTGSAFDPAAFDEGIPKDAFKSVSDPVFTPLKEALGNGDLYYAKDDSWFFIIRRGAETRLYPMNMLNWHHVANETFGAEPVGMSYCLLTGSSVSFASKLPERRKSFSVAGSLYNSNLILYDQQTGSLWCQLDLKAYTGVEKGRTMPFLPHGWVTLAHAKARYPDAMVLVRSTMYPEFFRMFDTLPGEYLDTYSKDERLLGPVWPHVLADKTYPLKELFILFPGTGKAFRFDEAPAFPTWVDTTLAGGKIVQVLPREGKPFITLYWFALKAFYPKAEILKAGK